MTGNPVPRSFSGQADEVEAVVTTHPQVHRAVVTTIEDSSGDRSLVTYVIPADAVPDSDSGRSGNSGAGDHVAQWRRVYDDMYSETEFVDESQMGQLGSDFIGWNSSYTGAEIPREEMRQWRAATVARIRELKPSRVLEIGVGSGLLMSHLGGEVEEYRGMDFSPVTIQKLRARLKQAGLPWAGLVHLRVAEATETTGLPDEYFDTVIINSVIMCFPGHGYLRRVLEQAMRVLVPGGSLFVGDVRNLSLLEEFRTAVQLARDPSADAATIRERVRREVATEQESLHAPEYFVASAKEMADVAGVDIQLKRGTAINELSRYRYDVVLHKSPARTLSLADLPRVAFADLTSPGIEHFGHEIERIMGELPGEGLRVTGIPHVGLVGEVAAAEDIRRGRPAGGVRAEVGWLPEDLHLLAQRLGLTAAVTWSAQPDRMDAIFLAQAPDAGKRALADVFEAKEPVERASRYTNYPQASLLAADVRRFVAERLPGAMVPAVVIVDRFPLTVDGELDHAALPAPDFTA